MFLAPWFALAGLIAAAGPVVIHLLNRHRYKLVHWAAMDFLREAIFRNRRIMRLRDLLLLALRMACLLLFGIAMARPFLGTTGGKIDPNQPVHAVLLVDNSLSMAYQELDGTLLDGAKQKAEETIDKLPRGSRISVLPTCGSPTGFSYQAYFSKGDAKEALERIQPVDRATLPRETIDLALEACSRVPAMAAKQIYLLSDQQVADWPSDSLADHLKQLPGPLEVVKVAPNEVDNAWISEFKLRDGVADLQTPAVFVAAIEYEGNLPRRDVKATLTVDGATIAETTVDLQPGQRREIEFAPYPFNVATEPGRPAFVKAEVSIPQDKLPADDQRFLVVPVVATLPVVFVDQWGKAQEDPQRNRYGETFHLRRLLSPLTNRAERDRQLVKIRHVTIDRLAGATGRDLLEDARLVVIAGVADPEGSVGLLREYVQQGGNLVIAAGGFFDPDSWTQAAWKDGLGILPASLQSAAVGSLPDEAAGELKWFHLDYNSFKNHDYFLLEGVSRDEQEDLYRLPYFFKLVAANVDDAKDKVVAATAKEIQQHRESLSEIDRQLAEIDDKEAQRKLASEEKNLRAELRRQRVQQKPSWLLWNGPDGSNGDKPPVEELAERAKPTVVARYDNNLPFMIEQKLGRGRVLMITTGVYSEWNTLSLTNTMLVYDRILRGMLQATLPQRNLDSQRQPPFPISDAERTANFELTGPGNRKELLTAEALGSDRWGITLGDLSQRGHYQLTATRGTDSPQQTGSPAEDLQAKLWIVDLAVNGPGNESQLLSAEELQRRRQRGQAGSLETIQSFAAGVLQQTRLYGAGLWWWFMLAVLACLLAEMTVLAWPYLAKERTA